MKLAIKPKPVRFTTKGQVVIPLAVRRAFQIETGTRAIVESTPQGILLRPITATAIQRGRGMLKKSKNSSLTAEWAVHKAEERSLEEKRHARHRS